MATAYENATVEKQRLELQRKQIDGRLAEIETFLRLHQQFESAPDVGGAAGELPLNLVHARVEPESATPEPRPRGVSQKDFDNHLLAILADAGRPLQFEDIRTKFADRNIPIGGQDLRKNLSSKLWAAVDKGGFHKIPKSGYWIEATYEPHGVHPVEDPTDPFGPAVIS